MIVCIDGTGVYNAQQYQKDMSNSFCTQIMEQKGFGKAAYFEGPGGLGLTTRGIGNTAVKAILDFYKDGRVARHSPLFLAGYSRGGACVLQIAKWLYESNFELKIKGLFLFDPVNRDLNLNMDGLGTPPNVKTVYIMLRDKTIEHVDFPNDPDRYARKWMGTCYWTPQNSQATRIGMCETIRDASHGAMGGCAWPDRLHDRLGELGAATAMNKAFRAEQLNVTLESRSFPPIVLPNAPLRIKLR